MLNDRKNIKHQLTVKVCVVTHFGASVEDEEARSCGEILYCNTNSSIQPLNTNRVHKMLVL